MIRRAAAFLAVAVLLAVLFAASYLLGCYLQNGGW